VLTVVPDRQPTAEILSPARPEGLTFSYDDVLLLAGLADGRESVEIGGFIDAVVPLTADAVRCRIRVLRGRMGARNRCQMVVFAMRWKVLT